jgi:hypothetical protein
MMHFIVCEDDAHELREGEAGWCEVLGLVELPDNVSDVEVARVTRCGLCEACYVARAAEQGG